MRIAAALFLLFLALPVFGEDRRSTGLIWNRSGLPATLPLVVESEPGQDHVVTLTRPSADTPAFAAYLRGGDVLRVLVPPGEWQVDVASGQDWLEPEAGFGPDMTRISLPQTLRFAVAGSRMEGHALAIRDGAVSRVRTSSLCRTVVWSRDLFDRPDRADRLTPDDPAGLNPARPDYPHETRQIEPLEKPDRQIRTYLRPCG